MNQWSFKMERAFPADDELARFIVGLGLINNEWHRTMELMPQDEPREAEDEARGVRLMLARLQAATCHEALKLIATAQKNYPDTIGAFIDGLSPEGQEHYRHFNEASDPKSPFVLPWLQDHRNVTLHVPELSPGRYDSGKDMIAYALKKAAPWPGKVSHDDTVRSVRFGFADVVSVQMLPWDEPNTIKNLSRARLALGGFVHEAVETYLQALPAGVVSRVREDS
jgi:hypothetical protein